MARQFFRAVESIPGIARKGDLIVLDPERTSIAVGHWVEWSELKYIMGHQLSSSPAQSVAPVSRRAGHLQLMD